ncbi:DNA double-strand break repair nuclease NurA [Hazenella coriacea]|uniref:NurA domain-containing protein n=1 Tax=Hazenella coriacea TaxID=1179467 RepID=A0A4R3L648_9BACL|nr:DNA double-strand break repair nuclease NurA [Hazenella coriacea]TCS94320.1 NurA domain-containing protein [Hazenella coriacea]
MLPVSEELKKKLKKLNESLRQLYPTTILNEQEIRRNMSEIGTFYSFSKWENDESKHWMNGRTLVGVDGSVNSTKGSQMRTLSVFQALAKGTLGEEAWLADVYTPLLNQEIENLGEAAREAQKRGALLSQLEMGVAEKAIQDWNPRAIMMDGSLLHFYIDDSETWMKLAKYAEEQDVYLIGVSEEISTHGLVRRLYPDYPSWSDRDLLYGVLQVGEAFEWREWSPSGSQMWKMAFRPSLNPLPIGLDGLESQREHCFDLIKLTYSLTPEQGRGIPFWLDIVDNQVRVTDPLVQTMVEQYIDPDLRYRLLEPKRNERII